MAHTTFQPTVRGKTELTHPLNLTCPEKSFLISVIHTDLPFYVPSSLIDLPIFVLFPWVRPGRRQQKSTAKDSDRAQSFKSPKSEQMGNEKSRSEKNETVPLCQSR